MAESTYWNRFWRRRISRRAVLGAGAVTALGAASAAVLGCNGGGGNGNGNGNGNGSGWQRHPGCRRQRHRKGGSSTPSASTRTSTSPASTSTALMYTYLYSWNRFTEEAVYNNLATDFEHPDDLTFIFTIRPDVVAWPTGPAAGEAAHVHGLRRELQAARHRHHRAGQALPPAHREVRDAERHHVQVRDEQAVRAGGPRDGEPHLGDRPRQGDGQVHKPEPGCVRHRAVHAGGVPRHGADRPGEAPQLLPQAPALAGHHTRSSSSRRALRSSPPSRTASTTSTAPSSPSPPPRSSSTRHDKFRVSQAPSLFYPVST